MYSVVQLKQLGEEYFKLESVYTKRQERLFTLFSSLFDVQAREYLLHGALRRFRIVRNCIDRVFEVYPPERKTALDEQELVNLCIHLHAFFMNAFGILDNLAWVLVFERKKSADIRRNRVGLYFEETQEILNQQFRDYLNTPRIKSWHDEHLKEFRDSLAHRVPLFVPPYVDSPNGQIAPFPGFAGSITQEQGMVLHYQLLADFNTIIEVIDKFLEFEFSSGNSLVGSAEGHSETV